MYKLIVIFAALVPLILLCAYHLWGAIEKGIAGVLRIQETDRSVGLGDLVHNWVRDRVLDRRANSFLMAMTLRECHFHPNSTPCQARAQSRVLKLGELLIRRSAYRLTPHYSPTSPLSIRRVPSGGGMSSASRILTALCGYCRFSSIPHFNAFNKNSVLRLFLFHRFPPHNTHERRYWEDHCS